MRIAVVAPSSRFERGGRRARDRDRRARRIPASRSISIRNASSPTIISPAPTRSAPTALVEVANDPAFDAIWFARGGYGSCRIAEAALARLGPAARDKAWLGYSDAGFLLAGLYRAGFANVAHGPMPQDVMREGGEAAVDAGAGLARRRGRRLRSSRACEPGRRHAAFNITVLGMLLGTPLEPDLAGHVLLLEEVSEHMYATDRALFHIAASPAIQRVAGIRLGRVSDVRPTIRTSARARRWSPGTGANATASPIWAAPTSATTRPTRWSRSASSEPL